jgi:capsular polysaccharide export protein
MEPSARVLVWGLKDDAHARKLAGHLGTEIERVEDGFIRSVGLGSDFSKPSSLIHDRRGIYFDPRQPSDLEALLNRVQLDGGQLARARRLQDKIVRAGINKYNSGRRGELLLRAAPGQQIILVPGQVEDDASIDAGGVDIKSNLELLKAVRAQQPDDYIIYKPHPDVLAGNRKGHIPAETARLYCDQIVTDYNMHHCLKRVDQVHTITSLTGFEALLLGKRVSTYGLPFYAGWGLTRDRHRIARRRRSLRLEELVYCTLIQYPRYYNWQFNCFVSAEDNVRWLQVQRRKHNEAISTAPLQHWIRKLRYLIEDMQIGWAS